MKTNLSVELTKQLLLKLNALEKSLVVYIGVTSLFIAFYHKQLTTEWAHFFVRSLILITLFLYAIFDKKYSNQRWFSIIRLFSPFLVIGYFYSETDYLNNLIFTHNLDAIFVNIEQRIFGILWSVKFSQLFSSNLFAEAMYFGYFSYYLLIIGVPLLIFIKHGKEAAEKAIFIIVNSFLIYYLIFIIVPVVGPQFFFKNSTQTLPQGYIFGNIIRTLQHFGEAPTAAFPSSHVSICLMLVWLCFKNHTKLLFVVVPIAILLIFSTVYIKAHYVIDVLAAFITTPIIFMISKKMFRYLTLKPV